MIARMLIFPAAVSFSCLPLCPSSAEQHRRIPHFASLSDNPASLFLIFVLAVAGFSVGDIGISGLGIIDDMGFDSFLLLW